MTKNKYSFRNPYNNKSERTIKAIVAFNLYKQNDFTYNELAKRMNVSRAYIAKLLRLGRDLNKMQINLNSIYKSEIVNAEIKYGINPNNS